uniref:Hypothetical 16.7K protein n=1 Tax=Chrysanthemum virus B TaxID=12165 RepID=Q7LZW7_CVB
MITSLTDSVGTPKPSRATCIFTISSDVAMLLEILCGLIFHRKSEDTWLYILVGSPRILGGGWSAGLPISKAMFVTCTFVCSLLSSAASCVRRLMFLASSAGVLEFISSSNCSCSRSRSISASLNLASSAVRAGGGGGGVGVDPLALPSLSPGAGLGGIVTKIQI